MTSTSPPPGSAISRSPMHRARHQPGTGTLGLGHYLDRVAGTGYDGWAVLEYTPGAAQTAKGFQMTTVGFKLVLEMSGRAG